MEDIWDESLFNDMEGKSKGRKNKRKADSTAKVSCHADSSSTFNGMCSDRKWMQPTFLTVSLPHR